MLPDRELTRAILTASTRIGLEFHRRYGCKPTVDRIAHELLTERRPWLAQLGDNPEQTIIAIITAYMVRNGCTTTLDKPKKRKRS